MVRSALKMLDLLEASGFDECLPAEVGKTRPFYGWGCREVGEEIEVVIKLRAGCPLGTRAMLVEALAAMLAADLDLPVPEPFVVEISREYADSIPDAEARDLAGRSLGLNFGLKKLPTGFAIWPPKRAVPVGLIQTAAEILVFDRLIGNDDRRLEKPNCLFDGKNLAIIDHEMAFPQITAGALFWKDPWDEGVFEGNRQGPTEHLFQRSIAGKELEFNRLQGAWEAIDGERLNEYFDALPREWAALDESREIVSYLGRVRDRLPDALEQIQRLLR